MATAYIVKSAESYGCPVSLFSGPLYPKERVLCLSTAMAHHSVKSQEFSLEVALALPG